MKTFAHTRVISATPAQVFAAMSHPERLARWWGPAGFSNTFEVCELRAGGRWAFTMHGPDGKNYPNESLFLEVSAPERMVIQHVSEPVFRLTIALEPCAGGTRVHWEQAIENDAFAENAAHILQPSNEQNLDRLTQEVLGA
ncbi:SRPBCC domain-containing protein [Massilia sp. TS11]|uniref:SRPBCC domain-containing protein n=1 Tax=Massilia sp. TS11 TaxID=2908003 RepID=UPI001EDB2A78|nr:SRPBCC domain-containing protein [Massilia sp. TS11]MCG2586847.1 SRPBCC domain-containing protein [Massilia sp. TS11]